MTNTLQDQLDYLPIQRLTTVLRVDLSLQRGEHSFDRTRTLIEQWWRSKAAAHGLTVDDAVSWHSLSNLRCRAEARSEVNEEGKSAFALALEELQPDPREPRDWITDVALISDRQVSRLSLRLSYRQPQNHRRVPEPRAPRFLREIVDLGQAVDRWPLSSTPHMVGRQGFIDFLELFHSNHRRLPLVVVSEDPRANGRVYADPHKLAQFLAGAAHVVQLSAEASWELSDKVGQEWSTFQGAVRCYNPQPDVRADKYQHRLWLADAIQRTDASGKDAFLNACVRHVFTQINARFESESLLTPATLRRQHGEQTPPMPLEPTLFETPTPAPESSSETAEIPVSPEIVTARLVIQEQMDKLLLLASQVEQLEQANAKLERDLQEERLAHATTRKISADSEGLLQLYQEEEGRDNEVRRMLKGDVSLETSEVLKPLWSALGPFIDALNNTATHLRTVESSYIDEQCRSEEAEAARDQYYGKASALERQLEAKEITGEPLWLVEVLPRLVTDLSLGDTLVAIEKCFPERITVLENARKTATDSSNFRQGSKAFDLLWRLATDYWQRLQAGGGDADAKSVFGKNYSPKESEKLSNDARKRRTFSYRGNPILMERHLKIGAADNASDTLRVHFEWIADEKRIVIGHCGRHLDF